DLIQKLETVSAVYKYSYAFLVLAFIVFIGNSKIISNPALISFLLSVFFSGLILSTLGTKNVFKISDQSILAKLGKYTYGLYLFHTILIMLFIKIGNRFNLNWKLIVALSFIASVVCSVLSYHLFEKQFLKLKSKIST
ncbi:acyltransferase family protein, partial [Chryseobacterium sp. HMWF001]